MKSFIILVILCSIILSKAGVLKRNLESLTDDSEDKNNKPSTLSKLSKYSVSFGLNNEVYGQNRAVSEDARIYGRHKRYPHRYRYYNSLDPSFQPGRDARNARVLKYRRNMPDRRFDSYNVDENRLSFNHQDVSVKSASRRDNNYAGMPKKNTHVVKANNNGRISDKINEAGSNPHNNQKRYSDKTSPVTEEKRDLVKKKHPKEKLQKPFEKLSSFQILVLLSMFATIASIILVIVVPITTFCWSKIKPQNREEDNDPETTMVKTDIVSKSPIKVKQPKESESHQDIVRNFISNDIDSEGDAVAKDMKLERWMMQGLPPRPQLRSKRNNPYLADMESVAEHSEIESTFEDRIQPLISPVESEDRIEELMPLSGRKKKSGRGDASKANRQESHPFQFPDVTVGRVINPRHPRHTDQRHTNPRNLHSLIHKPGRFGKPVTQSMVEIIP